MDVDEKNTWELFLETGDPMAYMLYRSQEENEDEKPVN